jgi:hypothetical protein
MVLDIWIISHDLCRDRVMILTPFIYPADLSTRPFDLIAYMRTPINQLMFSLFQGTGSIIRSENRKSPMQSYPENCCPCGFHLSVEPNYPNQSRPRDRKYCRRTRPVQVTVPLTTVKFRPWFPIPWSLNHPVFPIHMIGGGRIRRNGGVG